MPEMDLMEMVAEFNEKHSATTIDQTLKLGAEVGELQEAVLKQDKEEIAEELADVLYLVYGVADLEEVNLQQQVEVVAQENAKKNEEKEGGKVTKEKEEENWSVDSKLPYGRAEPDDEDYYPPHAGGCWFCYRRETDNYESIRYSSEFDAFYHPEHLRELGAESVEECEIGVLDL